MRCIRSLATLGVCLALLGGSDRVFARSQATDEGVAQAASDEEPQVVAQTPPVPTMPSGAAADADEPPGQPDLTALQQRLDALAAEVERLGAAEDAGGLETGEARALGLAPSAAAPYGRAPGVSLAGYGEMLYEDFAHDNQAGQAAGSGRQLDFLRAILYAGARFNDRFVFNSEIEFEHTNEVSLEFAYLDYRVHEHVGIRGGLVLVPMGLVNEFHEPTVFMGTTRPVTEQRIIPSTWRENGVGLYGSTDVVTFRAYVVNGLDASGFSSNGIRGGRQKGSEAKATDLAFTGRVDLTPTPDVLVGASLYRGGAGQGEIAAGGQAIDVGTTLIDVHGQAQIRAFDVRGLYARARVDDAAALNQSLGFTGADAVAESMHGGYLQVGYDVLAHVASGGARLTPYVRYERVDTQATMPLGFSRNPATKSALITAGVELKPIPNIVVKVDYTWVRTDADSGVNQFNINLGYAF